MKWSILTRSERPRRNLYAVATMESAMETGRRANSRASAVKRTLRWVGDRWVVVLPWRSSAWWRVTWISIGLSPHMRQVLYRPNTSTTLQEGSVRWCVVMGLQVVRGTRV